MNKIELFEVLRERILRLDLVPGGPLDEATLCSEYGVSRTPVREVLHRLAGDGFAKIEPNRGASVSSMGLETMRSFFQAAPMIYASVARLAAENATPEKVAELRAIQRRFRAAVEADDPQDLAVQNYQFHETIGEMAASVYLTPSLKRLLIDHTRMGQSFYDARSDADRGRIETACDQHDEMIDAFERHEPARAVELTLKHWALSRDRMERYARPDPLPIDPANEVRDAV